MDANRIGVWLQTLGSIGVFLGLVFLGLQIQQDHELQRAEFVWNDYESVIQEHLAMIGEQPHKILVKAALHPDDLTAEEALVMTRLLRVSLLKAERGKWMEVFGVSRGEWSKDSELSWAYGTEIGHRYFNSELSEWDIPDDLRARFREQLNSRRLGPDSLRQYLHSLGGATSQESSISGDDAAR